MIVLKSTMLARIQEVHDFYRHTSSLYEARITDLKNQIEDLKKLVFIPREEAPKELMEADAVISGSEKPFEVSDEEHNRHLESSREQDLLISGNYSEDLLN